jgi:RNA polymerase sigma factor (TIGR02999 family)
MRNCVFWPLGKWLRKSRGRPSRRQLSFMRRATALVHEAYLRLVDGDSQDWNSRGHFFKAAAEAMRRILVDRARRKKGLKRGGGKKRVTFDESLLVSDYEIRADDLLALDEALDRLSEQDPMGTELIKLRIFGGLTVEEAAELLGVSPSKAYADQKYARAWLRLAMSENETETES